MYSKSILTIRYESEIDSAKQALSANNIQYRIIANNKFEIDTDMISKTKDIMKQYEINFEIL